MFGNNYRIHFLFVLAWLLFPPITAGWILLRISAPSGLAGSTLFKCFFFSSVCVTYWVAKVQYGQRKKALKAKRLGVALPPEPQGRWIGNIDLIIDNIKNYNEEPTMDYVEAFFEKFNTDTFNLRILWTDLYWTKNHHAMQSILAKNFENYIKGPENKVVLDGVFGDGIFAVDGPAWRAHRAVMKPFFSRERVRDFQLLDKYTDRILLILRSKDTSNESLDMQDLFSRFTLDAAGEFLLGTDRLNSLGLPLPMPGRAKIGSKGTELEGAYGSFVNAFDKIQNIISLRYERNWFWPLLEFWRDETKEHKKVINDFIAPLIREAILAKRDREGNLLDTADCCFLEHLVDSTEDEKLIQDQLLNTLVAARDTTTALLTFLTYLLAIHPRVLRTVRDEVVSIAGDQPPSYELIRSMKYLRACLNETLRLFPPVPINGRASLRPAILPSSTPNGPSYYVPGGLANVFFIPLLMQRRKDLWGEDAEDFLPERWIEPNRIKELTDDPFKFLPFNAGPRLCLGQNFAYNEASFVIVRLLQNFDTFELRQEEDAPQGSCPLPHWKEGRGRKRVERVWPREGVTLYSKGGLWIRLSSKKH
ncbi:cytochrome P450 monooxygenase CYP63 [Cantharellus anzutake]|uniref:cytochrome P450 monooxygenase CYP63 n=1 Tax=Cantharellus anzutake TaxID=1750568 RepID=UPI0019034389|nr:cytochrome P450 monooxygenase CYP63 [Cantharellus anzutake]KAF8329542.1 cytochrome P450 monooxygenase CYP63 [Cantharellus anzutake]